MDFETFAIDTYEEPPQAIVLRLTGEFDLVSEPALQDALDGLCRGVQSTRWWSKFRRRRSWGLEV